jgi:hypothetical protein
MLGLIGISVTLAAAILGYMTSRRFVRTRLRYVDAAQRWTAPVLAGVGALILATPVTWLLPLVGGGTALLFGVAVGTGVAHGARDVKRGTTHLLEP